MKLALFLLTVSGLSGAVIQPQQTLVFSLDRTLENEQVRFFLWGTVDGELEIDYQHPIITREGAGERMEWRDGVNVVIPLYIHQMMSGYISGPFGGVTVTNHGSSPYAVESYGVTVIGGSGAYGATPVYHTLDNRSGGTGTVENPEPSTLLMLTGSLPVIALLRRYSSRGRSVPSDRAVR